MLHSFGGLNSRGIAETQKDCFSSDCFGKSLKNIFRFENGTSAKREFQVLTVGLVFMREYDRYLNLLYIRELNHHAHHVQSRFQIDFLCSDLSLAETILEMIWLDMTKMNKHQFEIVFQWNHSADDLSMDHSGHNNQQDFSIIKVTAEEKLRLFKMPDLHDPK